MPFDNKYQLEDLILEALRKQSCFIRVSDIDVGHVLIHGTLDISRLTEHLWKHLPPNPYILTDD